MKITMTVDCTPEEARAFFGFPNLEKIQAAVLEDMQKRVSAGIPAAEMQELFKLWMPASSKGWQDLQSMFWPGKTDKPDKA
ncbi:DUF6489 family protein [Govanella unica]|uniref:DUF6489 family protein n=1 Tax=Govanella unica TaxID=2975056 RepID=A0A9X3TV84_9PROT|nr:DUF6489 family protein [Govania unica]MDA5192386.1 DUF6489 family protein [Govania unica]